MIEAPLHLHQLRIAVLLQVVGATDRVEVGRHCAKVEAQHLRVYPAVIEPHVDVRLCSMCGGVDFFPELRIGIRTKLEPGVELGHLDEKLGSGRCAVAQQIQLEGLFVVVAVMPVGHPAQAVDDRLPGESFFLRGRTAMVTKTSTQGKLYQTLDFSDLLPVGRRPLKAQETGLNVVQIIPRHQLGVQSAGVVKCIRIIDAERCGKTVAVDVLLQAVGELFFEPWFVHPCVRQFHACLHSSLASKVHRELHPVRILEIRVFGQQRFDTAFFVEARVEMPVGPGVFGPIDLAAGIMRVVEFGQRALLVMHENDRVDRIGESVPLQIIENVIRFLVHKVPWEETCADFSENHNRLLLILVFVQSML